MKIFTSLLVLLACTVYSFAQVTFNDGTKSMGFGQIGVVASGDNLQSGHFQNPALLARGTHAIDAFANYQSVRTELQAGNNYSLTAGGMKTFSSKHALGVAVSLKQFESPILGNVSSIFIPVNYAFNVLKTDWSGVSIGAGVNLIANNSNIFGIGNVNNSLNASGNLGIDAYHILSISDNQFLRINGAFAVTNTPNPILINSLIDPNGAIRAGAMISWKYVSFNSDNFNLNVAYQYNNELPAGVFSETNSHHLGLEGRYTLEEMNISIAARVGTYWQPNLGDATTEFRTLGATVYLGSIYIDAAYLTRRGGLSAFNPYNVGIGYQVAL